MGVIFIDDTNLFLMDECMKSSINVWYESHDDLTSWGKLLIATGGTLKPKKCFYCVINYGWLNNESWQYTEIVDRDLYAHCADVSEMAIEQRPMDTSKKTMGIWTNPTGDCANQLETFTTCLTILTDRLSAGKFPSRWAWISYFQQL